MYICGIIKPHALLHADNILAALIAASITIRATKRVVFTAHMIETLYDHMSPEARQDIARKLIGSEGLALLLDTPSIEGLLAVVGCHSDPRLCAPNTIRSRFGIHSSPASVGQDPWWENAFHRPIDMREAKRDLFLIFNSDL